MSSLQLTQLKGKLRVLPLGGTAVDFLNYLSVEGGLSVNTLLGYGRDLMMFGSFCRLHRIERLCDVRPEHIYDFLRSQGKAGRAEASIKRALVAVKMLLRFGVATGIAADDFATLIDGPKLWQRLPTVAGKEKVLQLLQAPTPEDPYYLREMFRVGVHGYVLKKSGADDVVRAIRAAYRGEFHVDAALGGLAVSSLVAPAERSREGRLALLTPREKEVCRLLALGYTNVEAGQKLSISDRTVETHRTSIMSKLDLKNRAELVRFALDNDLIR